MKFTPHIGILTIVKDGGALAPVAQKSRAEANFNSKWGGCAEKRKMMAYPYCHDNELSLHIKNSFTNFLRISYPPTPPSNFFCKP